MRQNDFPPPYLFGRAVGRSERPAARIHRLCSDIRWRGRGPIGVLRNLWLILVWPVVAMRRAVLLVRAKGPAVRAAFGKTLPRQLCESVSLAIRFHVTPTCYYRLELYDPGRLRLAPDYLMRYETSYIAYRFLQPSGPRTRSLKNKMAFADSCAQAGIRHVPILMAFADGRRVENSRFATELPDHDLFVKRTLGKGGAGAELWRHGAAGRFVRSDGRRLERRALMEHMAALSRGRRGRVIVQPAVANCAALRDLSAGALCTARLVSIRNEAGGHEVTNASFRMAAAADAPVDNFHAGGIAAPVDVATGRLGKACDLGRGGGLPVWHTHHPLTGGPIEGRTLPMWPECVALALKAHAFFADWIVVGWDIAMLDGGVYLIEGNQGPDVDLIQRPLRRPIGNARFGQLLAMNMERKWTSTAGVGDTVEPSHREPSRTESASARSSKNPSPPSP